MSEHDNAPFAPAPLSRRQFLRRLGDFIFLTIFFAGARRFGLNALKTLIAMFIGFATGTFVAVVSQIALPAIPFMAAAFLLVHGRELMALIKEGKANN